MRGNRVSTRRLAALLVGCAAAALVQASPLRADSSSALRITSPLGRTGFTGTLRIVARIEGEPTLTPPLVRFYVDEIHLADDTDGPPYEALWTDENPFERREIAARAEFASGAVLTDAIVLDPLAITDAVDVSRVRIEASVTDANGRFVGDLAAADFAVFENAVPQHVDLVLHQREPALFTLLVDSSQSMALRASALRGAARALLDPLDPDDRVLVAPFSRGILSVTGPTLDRTTVLDAIAAIRPAGGTAILDSIQQAAGAMGSHSDRSAIVLITDGYDEHSTAEYEATVAALRTSGVALYAIGIGGVAGISLKGERLLKELAEGTGGRAWFPRDDRRLAEAYAMTVQDVQQKYLLTYTPANQRRDGTWRAITVATSVPGLIVRAREGYTAAMAPPIRAAVEFTAVGAASSPAAITREDLEVLEDGVPQEIDTFHEAVEPITIMLALDASGSMKRSAEQAQQAARGFVDALRPEDEIGLVLFADKPDIVHFPTTRRDRSIEAIDRYIADGGTALNDAVFDSLAHLGAVREGRRVVVVVTDGRDENAASNGPGSLRSWDEVLAKLQQIEATVYAVGLGSRVDRARLQQLATRSGGAAYFPADAASLAGDYHKILDELRRRYALGYESTNHSRDGEWRHVVIRSRDRAVTVRSRGGYFAPAE